MPWRHPLNHGDRYARKMLDLLIIVSAMETCPKITPPRPPVEGRQPPRGRNRSQPASNRGAYSAYSAFSAHFIGAAPALYRPVGRAPGLSSLSSLSSHISTGAPPSVPPGPRIFPQPERHGGWGTRSSVVRTRVDPPSSLQAIAGSWPGSCG